MKTLRQDDNDGKKDINSFEFKIEKIRSSLKWEYKIMRGDMDAREIWFLGRMLFDIQKIMNKRSRDCGVYYDKKQKALTEKYGDPYTRAGILARKKAKRDKRKAQRKN